MIYISCFSILFLYLFYFDVVEAFSVNSDNGTLRYKCVGVDIFDQPEDDGRLPLFGKYKHHFHFFACIEAGCIDNRYSTMRVLVDVSSYLFILAGYDEELDGLTCTVHYLVEDETANVKGCKSVYYFLPILQNEVTGGNDNHIADQYDSSQGDIPILVDDSGNDVRTAGTSVGAEGDSDTAAAERCSDDACHERLVLKKGDTGGQLLDNGKEESQGKYSENGFNTEI